MGGVISILAFLLIGCNTSVEIMSATRTTVSEIDRANIELMSSGQSKQSWEKFQLTANSIELLRTIHSEHTVFVNIVDCGEKSLKFPSVAFLDNIPLDDQQKKAADRLKGKNKVVVISGYAPTSFISRFKSICIELQGGSYLGSSLWSNLISVRPEASR